MTNRLPHRWHGSVHAVRSISLSLLFLASFSAVVLTLPQASFSTNGSKLASLHHDYDQLIANIERAQAAESSQHRKVVDETLLETDLRDIQSNTSAGKLTQARAQVRQLSKIVDKWDEILSKPAPVILPAPIVAGPTGGNHVFAPILLYHHPPANLEEQFAHLVEHGYVSVSLKQVADAMNGGTGLPDKPIVITFDDGFADQMPVLDLLKKYNLKAVFYIINGGQGSNFHIGANKKANDPEGGDGYLSWDQIRTLDTSGYAEIAAHTTDHLDLARQSPEVQRFEIVEGKRYLEEKLGHMVTNFCYPYGAFNASAIQIIKDAGFASATTTLPGTDQSVATAYTMRRIRDANILP
jgi:peptidoglycan/xylan/chitin deacetylase (PgdA/CDA1 family)